MTKSRTIGQFLILAIALGLFIAVVHRSILPVILGLVISHVYRPAFLWTRTKLRNRTHLSASISTFVVLVCVLLPLVLLGIFVYKDTAGLVGTMDKVLQKDRAPEDAVMSVPMLANVYSAVNKVRPITKEEFSVQAISNIQSLRARANEFSRRIAGSVPRKAVAIVFFLISFYFGLIDGPRLIHFLKNNLPFSQKDTQTLFTSFSKTSQAVVLGALLAGIVQGTIIGVAYWIFGIPRPYLFGVLTAVFSFVPLVGSAPTGIGGILFLLTNGRVADAIGMGIAFSMAGLSDNVVRPWVFKGKTELHPLLGLISVLGGLTLFGPAGLFLGPIITVLTITLLKIVPHRTREGAEVET